MLSTTGVTAVSLAGAPVAMVGAPAFAGGLAIGGAAGGLAGTAAGTTVGLVTNDK